MSLSTSYNVSATTFEQNVNAGDWKIIAELLIDTTGAKFLIQTRDGRQLVIKCTDYTQSTTVSLTGATFKTTTPAAADSGLVTRSLNYGFDTLGNPARFDMFTTGGFNYLRAFFVGSRALSFLQNTSGAANVELVNAGIAYDARQIRALTIADIVQVEGGNLNAITINFGGIAQPVSQNLLSASDVPNMTLAKKLIGGGVKALTAYAVHLSANGTTTPTAADAWVSSVVITTDVAGTGSTVTVQDKSATPKKLVNGLATTALNQLPNVLTLNEPVLMSGGIDIVTAGAVASTEDVWIDYWQ